MKSQVFRGIVLVSFLSMFICIALIINVLYSYFENELMFNIRNVAECVSYGVEKYGKDYFDDFQCDQRITWIAHDGTVIYDNQNDASTMENHANREEFKQALKDGVGNSVRYSSIMCQKTIYYAIKINDGSVVRVSNIQYTTLMFVMGIIQPILIIVVITIIFAGILASSISKRILKPINEMDLEQLEVSKKYEEITPLILKIKNQNNQIEKQMATLKRRQKEFNSITENMNEGLFVINKSYEVLSYNTSALNIFKIQEETFKVGENIYSIDHSEPFRKAIENAMVGSHEVNIMSIYDRNYKVIASPVVEKKVITGAVVLIMDITEQEQRETLRREFTSNVSHEMKTPLTSIHGISDMLVHNMISPEDIPRFAQNIYDESSRMINLVNDIMKLSQLDENVVPMPKTNLDLYAIADDVIHRLEVVANEKGVKFSLSGDHAIINGVYDIVQEMVYNICDNAVKYNKDNGSVDVSVYYQDKKPTIKISDTGIGIPEPDIDRIFERFYRVDKSHSRKIGGTGLGLSIVKHAVAFHNAEIKVTSNIDVGTTMIITFPSVENA